MHGLTYLKLPIIFETVLLVLSISSFHFKFSSIIIPKLLVLETHLIFLLWIETSMSGSVERLDSC